MHSYLWHSQPARPKKIAEDQEENIMNLSQKSMHVLFVDDDANIRTVARIGLEGLTDWEIDEAASGYEALKKAAERVPDLILLDVMMPGLDGPATFKSLKASLPLKAVPVIFVTAKVQNEEIQQYIRLGAAGVITKPFDPMTLPDDISSILSHTADNESENSLLLL